MKKSKTIAFLNSKGGCGKTTSLYHCAGVWSQQGRKVLIIDCDRQKNATRTFLANTSWKPDATVYTALASNFAEDVLDEAIRPALFRTRGNATPKHYGVDVLPGDARVSDSETLRSIGDGNLRQCYEEYTGKCGYDIVLIDMPPSSSEIHRICLGYLADYVLIPFSSDMYSVTGYGDIDQTVKKAQEVNPALEVLGIFLARYMSYCGVDRYIRERLLPFDKFIDIQIPIAADVREAVMHGRPISYYKADSNSRRAYESLVADIDGKTGLTGKGNCDNEQI